MTVPVVPGSDAILTCADCEAIHPCVQVLSKDKVTGRLLPRYLCRDHCYKVWQLKQEEKREHNGGQF